MTAVELFDKYYFIYFLLLFETLVNSPQTCIRGTLS
jgi:hypothetical protein